MAEEGEEQWTGRFSCGRVCERLYDCGIHPCKEVDEGLPVRSR